MSRIRVIEIMRRGPRGAPGDMDPAEWDQWVAELGAKASQADLDSLELEVDAKLPIADVLNEPDMATGATDKPPSQASVKAYADLLIPGIIPTSILQHGPTVTDGYDPLPSTIAGPAVETPPRRYRTLFWDDFSRSDRALIGDPSPTGHVWTTAQSGDLSLIEGAQMHLPRTWVPGSQANYPYITLDQPAGMMGGLVSMTGTSGTNNSCTFICSSGEGGFASGHPVNMLHISILQEYLVGNLWIDDVPQTHFWPAEPWGTPIPLDGTPRRVQISWQGTTLTVIGPDARTYTVDVPDLPQVVGPLCMFEIYYNNDTQDIEPRYDAVWAGVHDDASALWVEPARTNYVLNPGAEADPTGNISANSSGTRTRSTEWAASGTYSLKFVPNGGAAGQGPSFLSADNLNLPGAGDAFVGAAMAYAPDPVEINAWVTILYTDATTQSSLFQRYTVGPTPRRIVTNPIVPNPAKTIRRVYFYTGSYVATTLPWYLDEVDVQRGPAITSHISGGLGDGYAWTGTANGSASTRAASTFAIPSGGRLDPVRGSVLLRVLRERSAVPATPQVLFDIGDGDAGHDRLQLRITTAARFEMAWTSNGGSETVVTLTEKELPSDVPLDLYAWWHGTNVGVALFNSASVTGTRTAPQGSWGTRAAATIGTGRDGASPSGAIVQEVVASRRRLRIDELVSRVQARDAWGFV